MPGDEVALDGHLLDTVAEDTPPVRGLTRQRMRLVRAMVWDGLRRQDAAAQVQMTDRGARYALTHPAVCRYHRQQLDALRESERANNIRRAVELRQQDTNKRVSLDACRYLDGERAPGTTINVGVGVGLHTNPGYIVSLPQPRAEIEGVLRAAGSSRSIWDAE